MAKKMENGIVRDGIIRALEEEEIIPKKELRKKVESLGFIKKELKRKGKNKIPPSTLNETVKNLENKKRIERVNMGDKGDKTAFQLRKVIPQEEMKKILKNLNHKNKEMKKLGIKDLKRLMIREKRKISSSKNIEKILEICKNIKTTKNERSKYGGFDYDLTDVGVAKTNGNEKIKIDLFSIILENLRHIKRGADKESKEDSKALEKIKENKEYFRGVAKNKAENIAIRLYVLNILELLDKKIGKFALNIYKDLNESETLREEAREIIARQPSVINDLRLDDEIEKSLNNGEKKLADELIKLRDFINNPGKYKSSEKIIEDFLRHQVSLIEQKPRGGILGHPRKKIIFDEIRVQFDKAEAKLPSNREIRMNVIKAGDQIKKEIPNIKIYPLEKEKAIIIRELI